MKFYIVNVLVRLGKNGLGSQILFKKETNEDNIDLIKLANILQKSGKISRWMIKRTQWKYKFDICAGKNFLRKHLIPMVIIWPNKSFEYWIFGEYAVKKYGNILGLRANYFIVEMYDLKWICRKKSFEIIVTKHELNYGDSFYLEKSLHLHTHLDNV